MTYIAGYVLVLLFVKYGSFQTGDTTRIVKIG